MGIDKLTDALENDELFEHIDLSKASVGIDATSLLRGLHLKLKTPNDYEQLDLHAAKFIEQLRSKGITPVVVFQEQVKVEDFKLKALQDKKKSECEDVKAFVVYWERQIYTKSKDFPVRILSEYQILETLKANNVKVHFASGDAIHVLQEMLREGKIDYILSDTAETCAHSFPEMSWCRLQTLKLPFGDVVKTSKILEKYDLDYNDFLKCCLWSGTDATTPYLSKFIRRKYKIPDSWSAIVKWVLDNDDVEALVELKEKDVRLFDIWTAGLQALEPLETRKPFTGIFGSSGLKLRKHIFPNPWRFVHPQSDDVLAPIENLLMNMLELDTVKIYLTTRTLTRKPIMEGLEEKFNQKSQKSFLSFLTWYLSEMTKQLELKDIEPFVWDVWIEEVWFYYYQCKSAESGSYSFKPPSKLTQIMKAKEFKIPETSTAVKDKMLADNEEKSDELPIVKYKDRIMNKIKQQKISMVCASTGSGKSSMIPQWLIDDKGGRNNVLVTQPRRMATSGIAHYVSKCRGETVGGTIGYKVGHGGGRISSQTRLIFCTTGYITERITHDTNYLKRFSHICLDEVHERSLDMDLLLRLIKSNASSYKYKIVLMSATLNTESLQKYFDVSNISPVMIETQIHPIETFYLEDIKKEYANQIRERRFREHLDRLGAVRSSSSSINTSVTFSQTVLITELIKYCSTRGKSTLVFCSGIALIMNVSTKIQEFRSPLYRVKILHSAVPLTDDNDLLPDPLMYNIYLASDVAESSITLVDCDFVIDCCMQREICVEEDRSILRSIWAPKDSLKQRKGRTGRVCPGRVFRLISEDLYEDMRPTGKPEILKMHPLELAYKLKKSMNDEIIPVLKELPTVPEIALIEESLEDLWKQGILTSEFDDESVLTPMGDLMKAIPLELRASQIVMVGIALGCPVDAIILACFLSLDHDPFRAPKIIFTNDPEEHASDINKLVKWKRHYAEESESEAFLYCKLFRDYAQFRNYTGRLSQYDIKDWCNERLVVKSRLSLWYHRVKAVAQSLDADFEGKAWLIGEGFEPPATIPPAELRIFMLIFNSWSPFKWKNSTSVTLKEIPRYVDNHILKERIQKILYPHLQLPSRSDDRNQNASPSIFGAIYGTGDDKDANAQSYLSAGWSPSYSRFGDHVGKVMDHAAIRESLGELFHGWSRSKSKKGDSISLESNDLYRRLLPHVVNQRGCSYLCVSPISEDAESLPFEMVQAAIALPRCHLSQSNAHLIIDNQFPWQKTDCGWLTFLGANYVSDKAFGMGVTIIRKLDLKQWDNIMEKKKSELFRRLDHVKRTANEDKNLLMDLHMEVKSLYLAPPKKGKSEPKKKKADKKGNNKKQQNKSKKQKQQEKSKKQKKKKSNNRDSNRQNSAQKKRKQHQGSQDIRSGKSSDRRENWRSNDHPARNDHWQNQQDDHRGGRRRNVPDNSAGGRWQILDGGVVRASDDRRDFGRDQKGSRNFESDWGRSAPPKRISVYGTDQHHDGDHSRRSNSGGGRRDGRGRGGRGRGRRGRGRGRRKKRGGSSRNRAS